ncbi:MAG: AI-2E family transporter [Patescibacteria group bacterium]
MRIPFLLKLIFNRYFFEKFVAMVLLGILLYTFESFLFIFLITFLFAYLFLDLAKWIELRLGHLIKRMKASRFRVLLVKINRLPIVVTIIYIGFVTLIATIFYNLVPHLIEETKSLIKEGPQMMGRLQSAADSLQGSVSFDLGLDEVFTSVVNKAAVESTLTNVFENVKNIGIFLFKVLIALILSYVFIIDRERIE